MFINKKWYIKDSKLYQPNKALNQFLWVWFVIVFFITLYLLKSIHDYYSFYLMLFLMLINVGNFLKDLKKFGWLGKPVLYFSESKIILYALNESIEVNIFLNDEIHIVGIKNQRFIRFINKNKGNRELKLNQRLIKFVVNRLKKNHKVIYEDYPSLLSQFRRDF